MDTLTSRWIALAPYLLSVLRIMAAFVFVEYGTGKMLAWPGPLMPGAVPPPGMRGPGHASILPVPYSTKTNAAMMRSTLSR